MKRYVLIAGVNGAGKSTFFASVDSFDGIEKINLDETVRGIGSWKNTSDVIKAGRIVVGKIKEYFDNGVSFSQETTLCGSSILKNIRKAKGLGYFIELYFIGLDSVETAQSRVHYRVEKGGHGISDEDIERRYYESLRNLKGVIPICDAVYLYDNTVEFKRFAIFRDGKCVRLSKNVPEWYGKI